MEVMLMVNGIIRAAPMAFDAARSFIALFKKAAPQVQVDLVVYEDGLILDAAGSLARMDAWLAENPPKK